VTGIANVSREIGVPDSIQGSFQGTAAAFQQSTQNMGMLLLIAIIVATSSLAFSMRASSTPSPSVGPASAAMGRCSRFNLAGLP